METIREKVSSLIAALPPSAQPLVVPATIAAAALTTVWLVRVATRPGDGDKYANAHQLAIPTRFRVDVGGREVAVEKLDRAAIPEAAATLAAANRADPMLVACGAVELTDESRETALRWLYKVLLSSTLPTSLGAVNLRTEGSKAVAIWYTNGQELAKSTLLRNGGLGYLWRYSGWDRRGRFPAYSTLIRAVKARLMASHEGAYFYLLTHGVSPTLDAAAKKEELTAVVAPVLQQADALGQPCYVEVTNPESVSFFRALGFERVDAMDPTLLFGVSVECLKREAKKALPSAAAK